jgi:phage terminase large subunit GpA-like protein
MRYRGHALAALRAMRRRAWRKLKPRARMSMVEWAVKYRVFGEGESALPGKFSWDISPALIGVAEAASDPKVRKIVGQKSAQLGWTAGIECNVLGYHTHYKPSVCVAAFPRAQAAKDFAAEKLDPMILNSPALAKLIELKSRAKGNSTLRKHFPGGLMKLVGTNSPSDVKSTSARVVIVAEPDDAASDVRGQGNSIKLLEERAKTFPDHIIVIGGTPTAKGASTVEDEMRKTDKRHFHCLCHACGERHVLDWSNVTIPEDKDAQPHEVYGRFKFAQAYYTCPHCGAVWTDDERIANIRRTAQLPDRGWIASAESAVPGFYMNELLSTFDLSRVPELARKYLEAKHNMDRGEPEDMVAFWNSTLGLPWEFKGELPEEDELRDRAEAYAEWSCPEGGLVALMTFDVQHDRLACTVWVFGRGEEMWLAYWGEVYGPTVVPLQGAWLEAEKLIQRTVRHSCGARLPMAAVAVDVSDGQTSDASYAFVRKHSKAGREVVAVKGANDNIGRYEIWVPPKPVDPNARATKASRYGLKVHIVGTAKAKDAILGWSEQGGRVRLEGNGPARMHWYEGVRDDFYAQMLSEIKVPSRNDPKRRVWKPLTDRRNEGLDCTVYAVYLYRHLKLHLRKPKQWDLLDLLMRQAPLIPHADGDADAPPPERVDDDDPFAHEKDDDDDGPRTPGGRPPTSADADLWAPIGFG